MPDTPTQFWYGTDLLWTVVHQYTWHAGGNDGAKLPYFGRGYDLRKRDNPSLAVVARRIDAVAPLVWAGKATSGWLGDPKTTSWSSIPIESMFMLTGIDIPTAGCWEISAHYADQTLTYTVRVER